MYLEHPKKRGKPPVLMTSPGDQCGNCQMQAVCPLLAAVAQEAVILAEEEVLVTFCPLYEASNSAVDILLANNPAEALKEASRLLRGKGVDNPKKKRHTEGNVIQLFPEKGSPDAS